MRKEAFAQVEPDPHYRKATDTAHPAPDATVSDVICYALRHAASILPVKAVVTYTTSGFTSLRAARERPAAPILGLTPDIRIARRLCLVWGTYPVQTPETEKLSEIVEHACAVAADQGLAEPGELIAIAAGMPFGVAGTTTNLLRIARLPGGLGRD